MRFTDIYDERDFEEDEPFLFGALTEEALEYDFEVRTMPASELGNVKTILGDLTVVAAMRDLAEDWQHELIAYKRNNFDEERVVLMDGNAVIDGNHHMVAAYHSNRDLKFIHLEDALGPAPPAP